MGRRFNEHFVNHGKSEPIRSKLGLLPSASGRIVTVKVGPEHIKEQHCPLCDGVHFRQLVRIFAMPKVLEGAGCKSEGGSVLAFVAVMSCRGCGWIMPNENTPLAVENHGRLRPCEDCGCECHEQCFSIGKISRLITGGDKDKIVMREEFLCPRCGKQFAAERRGAAKVGEGNG